MIRGRITALNGVPSKDVKAAASAKWVLNGDRGITYAETLPENAALTESVAAQASKDALEGGRAVEGTANAMKQIGKYAQVLKISKGGITISGGEPMMQRPFVMQIFRRCKALGLHTCLDTSGRLGDKFTDEQLMDIDLNLLDIKSGDPAIYEKITRQPLKPTLDYAQRLSALGRPLWVRFVLVPGLSDGHDNVEKVADICAGLKSLERVEILRFHQMGKDKWHKLGLEYPLENAEPQVRRLVVCVWRDRQRTRR